MQDSYLALGTVVVLIAALLVVARFLNRLIARQDRLHAILMFDRRFALYRAAQTLIDDLLLQRALPEGAVPAFKAAVAGARFLVGESLSKDLNELAQCALSIQKLRDELTPTLNTNERVAIAGRLTAENTWVSSLADSLPNRFAAYLEI